MGSITSRFQFTSYKIDRFTFTAIPNLMVLQYNHKIEEKFLELKINLRQPVYFEKQNIYVGGVDIKLELAISLDGKTNIPEKLNIFTLDAGIAGMFSPSENNRFEKETEENLVKHQIPAILFPYLRGAVTTFLANAGFSSIILPLINMHELSKNNSNIEIKII